MLVFCVGMYRACSTWQYGVASEILERHRSVHRIGFIDGGPFASTVEPTLDANAWQILKAHDADDHYARALVEGRALGIYSHRDLRDVMFSWMHKTGAEFQDVVDRGFLDVCLKNDQFWRSQPGMLVQTYEDLIANPVQGVREIAEHLGVALNPGEAEEIAAAHSPEANRKRTSDLADQLVARGVTLSSKDQDSYDPQSLLHWNHLREGRVGGWRDAATPDQMVTLARICGAWLLDNGYEPDDPWTRSTLASLVEHSTRADALARSLDQEIATAGRERLEHEQAQQGLREQREAWQRERDSWQRERDSWQAERDMIQRERDMVQRERDDRQRERDSWIVQRAELEHASIARITELERSSMEKLEDVHRKLIDHLAESQQRSLDRLANSEQQSLDHLADADEKSLDRLAEADEKAVERLAKADRNLLELIAESNELRESLAREHAWAVSDRQALKREQERFEQEKARWTQEREDLQKALEVARQPNRAGRLIKQLGLVTSLYHRNNRGH